MLDAFVRAESEPESVQLSGGEPSIHPQILDMLAAAKRRGIKLVMLNTNGSGSLATRDSRRRSPSSGSMSTSSSTASTTRPRWRSAASPGR